MKKVLSFVLVLCVCVALMSVAAFAAASSYSPEGDGTYSIGYTEGSSGSYYALLVVEGIYAEDEAPAISEDSVLYIDQATADANGDVSFDGWYPKNDEPATVYLGGSDLDAPVLLGYLGANNFKVAGTVTAQAEFEATITLTDAASNVFTATSVNGAYEIEVPEGTYTFNVNVKNHLSYTQNGFVVNADVSGKNVNVVGGDLNGDGVVDFGDLKIVSANYGAQMDEGDFNGDGVVDFGDLKVISANYYAEARVID